MGTDKIEKNTRLLLTGTWSAKRYAYEVTAAVKCSKKGPNCIPRNKVNVASKPIPLRSLHEKLCSETNE